MSESSHDDAQRDLDIAGHPRDANIMRPAHAYIGPDGEYEVRDSGCEGAWVRCTRGVVDLTETQ